MSALSAVNSHKNMAGKGIGQRPARLVRTHAGDGATRCSRMPLSLKLNVQPVEHRPVQKRAVCHLAMPAGSFGCCEPDHCLFATKPVVEPLGKAGKRIFFSCRDQGRAAYEFRSPFKAVGLDRAKKIPKTVDALDPIASLDNAPAKFAICHDHLLHAIQQILIYGAEIGHLLGRSALASSRHRESRRQCPTGPDRQ